MRKRTTLLVTVVVVCAASTALAQGPPNDDCITAINIDPLPAQETGDTTLAQNDPDVAGLFCGTSVSDPSAGVWYVVTGTGNTMTATTCFVPGTDYDTKLHVWCDGCEVQTCVDGNDDQAGGFDPACETTGNGFNRGSTVSFCTQAGFEYLIFVSGFTTSVGNFTLGVTDDNDPCTPSVICEIVPVELQSFEVE